MPMVVSTTITATAVAMDHSQFFPAIFATAHTAMIGALMKIISPIAVAICICVMSLVDLVIRLAVENLFISALEKDCTFPYCSPRSVFARDAAMYAAMNPIPMDMTRLPKAHRIIMPPSW